MTNPDPAAGATADAGAATTETTTTGGDNLLAGVDPAAAGTSTATTGDDWLPEKFRVLNDGKLDEAASARKLADSYRALEAHKGAIPQVPATPDDYKLTPPEGVDADGWAQMTGDDLFKAFAKDAHARGMTNEQLQFVTEKYLSVVPQFMAAHQSLSAEEASAELGKVWTSEDAMKRNLAGVVRAINGFGAEADDVPGSRSRLMEKYGTDPDFIAFAAAVSAEMKEDQPVTGAGGAAEHDIEALQKSEAYWKPEHPDHAKVKEQVDAYYARKHGTRPRAGGIVQAR